MTLDDAMQLIARLQRKDVGPAETGSLVTAVTLACSEWQRRLQAVGMQGQRGAPDWRVFELRIFALGETLRHAMINGGPLAAPLLEPIADVARDPKHGKGRQTFVLLLGQFGGDAEARLLGELLRDPDVAGHAVKALTQGRMKGFHAAVLPLCGHPEAWIRQGAKRYVTQVDPVP